MTFRHHVWIVQVTRDRATAWQLNQRGLAHPIPCGPSSIANTLLMVSTAAFDAL